MSTGHWSISCVVVIMDVDIMNNEPVMWTTLRGKEGLFPLYTIPRKHEWTSLSTDEILNCAKDFEGQLPEGWMKIVYAAETLLREKNT
jgi:hypothetical protein